MVGACGLNTCYKCVVGGGGLMICVNDPSGTFKSCTEAACGSSGGCSQVCDPRCYNMDLYNRRCDTNSGSCVQDTLNKANAPECGGSSGNEYTVNMTIVGSGSVTIASGTRATETVSSSNTKTYSQFDDIHYTANAASGYQFTSYNIGGSVWTATPYASISVINANKNVTVTFTKIATGAVVLNSVQWVTPGSTLSKIRLNVTTNGSTSTYLKVDADTQKTLIYSSTTTYIDTTDVYTTAIPHGVCIGTPTPTQCMNLSAVGGGTKYYRCDNTTKKCVEDSSISGNQNNCTSVGQACGGDVSGLVSIVIDTTKTVNVGATATIGVTCKNISGNAITCPSLGWGSVNSSIVDVSNSGVITGVSVGTMLVNCWDIATGQIVSNSCKVTVGSPSVNTYGCYNNQCLDGYGGYPPGCAGSTCANLGATTINIPTSKTVVIGKTVTISPVVCKNSSGTTITCPTLSWKSSDESIATVSSSGVVTGISSGSVSINCKDDVTQVYSNFCIVTIVGGWKCSDPATNKCTQGTDITYTYLDESSCRAAAGCQPGSGSDNTWQCDSSTKKCSQAGFAGFPSKAACDGVCVGGGGNGNTGGNGDCPNCDMKNNLCIFGHCVKKNDAYMLGGALLLIMMMK